MKITTICMKQLYFQLSDAQSRNLYLSLSLIQIIELHWNLLLLESFIKNKQASKIPRQDFRAR